MTRKDYEKLANGFGKAYALAFGNELQIEGVWSAIRVTMSALQDDNPRFNHDRFIAAIQKSFELQRGGA